MTLCAFVAATNGEEVQENMCIGLSYVENRFLKN